MFIYAQNVCLHMEVYVHIYLYLYAYVQIPVHICVYTSMEMYILESMKQYMFTCTYVSISKCIKR